MCFKDAVHSADRTRCCKLEWRTHVPGLYLTSNLALMLSLKGKVRENCYLCPTNWADKQSPAIIVGKEDCLFKVSLLQQGSATGFGRFTGAKLMKTGLSSSKSCRADRSPGPAGWVTETLETPKSINWRRAKGKRERKGLHLLPQGPGGFFPALWCHIANTSMGLAVLHPSTPCGHLTPRPPHLLVTQRRWHCHTTLCSPLAGGTLLSHGWHAATSPTFLYHLLSKSGAGALSKSVRTCSVPSSEGRCRNGVIENVK